MYELLQGGGSHQLFIREGSTAPRLGEDVKPSASEKSRFAVYSEDFAGRDAGLFLTEMNRGKKYEKNSKIKFFSEAFNWIMNNVIVINPNVGISNTEAYYNDESLENISRLIQTFDTGVTDIKTRKISVDEMSKMVPAEVVQGIFAHLKLQMQMTSLPVLQLTWRVEGGFFNIRIEGNAEPEINKTRRIEQMAADSKKEKERDEVHRAIWAIADELRGAVDGWDFKNYVLGTMFYRYISENLAAYIDQGEIDAGNKDFSYALMSDEEAEEARDGLVTEKGFFILPSELFCNVTAKAANDDNLNETLEKVFNNIENSAKGSQSEADFAGLFDDFDVNSNKLGSTVAKRNERLAKLLDGVASMNLGSVKDHDIDAFGDAYEYLMTMYASNAGKSGGEFFTPADVSELLTRLGTVGKKKINKVYDPACGSGSLLLKAEKILGKDAVEIGFFGQEINITTFNLCRINMFLHDIGFDKFDIECEDTLTNPQHWDDEPFELIVSNPPYSIKWAGDDNPLLINDPRFSPAGVLAPKSKADLAFIMHSLSWLAPNGTAAIVCFPGIMYRGGSEQKIRKYLIDNNYVDCVIQLPSNLFFGTSIATCIMVMKKGKADNKVLFIDASNECVKVTNNNRLTQENIDNIVNAFVERKDINYLCRLVSYDEVKEHNYNLSVSTYVEQKDTREKVDIVKLNAEIKDIVAREQVLRDEIDKIIAEIEGGQEV